MSEFSTELLNEVQTKYRGAVKKDKTIAKLVEKIASSKSYKDCYKYAVKLGEHLSDSLFDVFSILAIEGVSDVYYGTAMQVLEPTMTEVYSDVAEKCAIVQTNLNLADGIRVKAQVPRLDEFNIRDLARNLADSETLDSIQQNMNHFAQKVVDDSIQENAEFSNNLGYEITVTRTYDDVGLHGDGELCDFCASREGTKTFASWSDAQGDEIFQRHAGCECTIEYSRSGGTKNLIKNFKRKK